MIVAEDWLATGEVVTVKFAVRALAATVTEAGAWAADELLFARVTTLPPAGAGPLNVTVPVEELPPLTVVGFRATELTAGGFTVSDEPAVTPP